MFDLAVCFRGASRTGGAGTGTQSCGGARAHNSRTSENGVSHVGSSSQTGEAEQAGQCMVQEGQRCGATPLETRLRMILDILPRWHTEQETRCLFRGLVSDLFEVCHALANGPCLQVVAAEQEKFMQCPRCLALTASPIIAGQTMPACLGEARVVQPDEQLGTATADPRRWPA